MRRLLLPLLAVLALAAPSAALAAPNDGFVVYKDVRGRGITEVYDAKKQFLYRELKLGGAGGGLNACLDSRFRFFGHRWRSAPTFLVAAGSIAGYLDSGAAVSALLAGSAAWQSPFATDCPFSFRPTSYGAAYGGDTTLSGSLADGLTTDGANVIEFRSLSGTVCDGAVACTIVEFSRGRAREADMLFELDLGRFGFDDTWSTGESTWSGPTQGVYAIVDVATHEFGHFAGLDHVERSPSLTMYPVIHDGMQTLGLGDLLGLRARY